MNEVFIKEDMEELPRGYEKNRDQYIKVEMILYN